MILTHELIEQGMSGNGGWSQRQLALLGVAWPPRAGWKELLASSGVDVPDAVVSEFLSLKGKHREPSAPPPGGTAPAGVVRRRASLECASCGTTRPAGELFCPVCQDAFVIRRGGRP